MVDDNFDKTLARADRATGGDGASGGRSRRAPSKQLEFALLEVQRLLQKVYNNKFVEEGLHYQQSALLHYVRNSKRPTQSELAALMQIGRPAVGDLIDQLEEKGFVRRVAVPGDRRARIVALTSRGTAQLNGVDALFKKLGVELRIGTTKAERQNFLRFLEKLMANLNAM